MAGSDYCSCSVCGCKAFYDANISDSKYTGFDEWTNKYLQPEEMVHVACLCVECSKKYTLKVVEKE